MTLPAQIRGFLIDLDGTVTEAQKLVPGVPEALSFLRDRKIPYRLVTNTTSKPRSAILTKLQSLGLDLPLDTIITAPVIGREYLLQRALTRTGKFRAEQLENAAVCPDRILDSLADLINLLGS